MEQAPSSFSMFFKHYMKTRHLQLILKKHYTGLKEKKKIQPKSYLYCNNGKRNDI